MGATGGHAGPAGAEATEGWGLERLLEGARGMPGGLRVSIPLHPGGPGLQVSGGACSATCQVPTDGLLEAFQSQRSRTVLPGGGGQSVTRAAAPQAWGRTVRSHRTLRHARQVPDMSGRQHVIWEPRVPSISRASWHSTQDMAGKAARRWRRGEAAALTLCQSQALPATPVQLLPVRVLLAASLC